MLLQFNTRYSYWHTQHTPAGAQTKSTAKIDNRNSVQ